MKKIVFIILVLAAGAFAADWKLVWSDEFDKDGLPNPAKWTYEVGYVRNGESQCYTSGRKENARVEKGVLIIEARKEKIKIPEYKAGSNDSRNNREYTDITAASLITKGLQEWTYGRIEVRAQLPTGRGTWPAIWMLGSNIDQIGWPACGEIDIMENVGFNPDTIHANIHTKKYNHMIGTGKGARILCKKPYESFHVYAVEWFPDHMDFFLDNTKYFTFKNEGTGRDVWPYDLPHYLILNLAIGGAWGGIKGVDDSIFPQRFLIDYVRVYQKK